MAIQILPARLANQIAAGEVVERPASVIKELVENSLDAGATKIHIDIEKGGAKKIKIADNGCGIVKEELGLALSRHATSKITNLSDLEAIASLGFRGEALASISSVARLTLTSKPAEQENAWQAFAEGRDMDVTIKPAAHPNGTTIEVNDLFFNTPARRKFLRTEKTEFNHIDEVIRRIALARFDVGFTLTHNGKTIRQYREATSNAQYVKRVASVCGQKFVDSSIEIKCRHDNLHLWGWIAKPSYTRPNNDLCYSYVNGRMMRDKLINHGIRQAYADLISGDGYPAFVLFLELDHKEVDVNVHPAKHEVRFHQGRYVHDFIFSVCHQALQQANTQSYEQADVFTEQVVEQNGHLQANPPSSIEASVQQQLSPHYTGANSATERSYVKPLAHIGEPNRQRAQPNDSAAQTYQQLMTPYQVEDKETSVNTKSSHDIINTDVNGTSVIYVKESTYAVIVIKKHLRLLALDKLAQHVERKRMIERWQTGIVSQPLLLPVMVKLSSEHMALTKSHITLFEKAGILVDVLSHEKLKVRQFPAMLRDNDVQVCLMQILNSMMQNKENITENTMISALVAVICASQYSVESATFLLSNAKIILKEKLNEYLHLNSVEIDLTSEISRLN
ncbi:DNA mismatch repair endonuclease MutL [Thalassotalea atypica]|uniref:DNA mismatch repair endonuclease MutL n=1 Tax=Thalassotalea atypica TaxID=2054316 RepID=UPI0025735FB7|nr:DNA mismatch repair endonuclease MutL [Thalassotalea atypica]